MVRASLVILDGLIIDTVEGYLVVLSLGLPLGSPLDSPNTGAQLPVMVMGALLGLWFGSDVLWRYILIASLYLQLLSHLKIIQ